MRTLVLCLTAVVLGLRAEDVKKVEGMHLTPPADDGPGGSAVHGMKKRVDDVNEHVHHGVLRVDDPLPHPIAHTENIKPVNLKPELESNKVAKSKETKKRLTKKRKVIIKRPSRRTKKVLIGSKPNRKSKTIVVRKNLKPRNNKRRMRKLPTSKHQTIVDRIVEEHKKGKASTISTTYLQERIRALLEKEGFVTLPKCKTNKKLKRMNKRKRLLRRKMIANRKNRKQIRNLKPRLVNKNKNVPAKVKKAMDNKVIKVKNVVEKKNKKAGVRKNVVVKGNKNNLRKKVVVKKIKNGERKKNKLKGGANKRVKKQRTNRKHQKKENSLNEV